MEGSWGQPQGPNFPSPWATLLALRLYCSTAALTTPQTVLTIWELVELKMLDFRPVFPSWHQPLITFMTVIPGALVGGCRVERRPPPRVLGVQAAQLLPVEQIFEQLGIVPQCGHVQQTTREVFHLHQRLHSRLKLKLFSSFSDRTVFRKISHF